MAPALTPPPLATPMAVRPAWTTQLRKFSFGIATSREHKKLRL